MCRQTSFLDGIAPTPVSGSVSEWVTLIVSDLELASHLRALWACFKPAVPCSKPQLSLCCPTRNDSLPMKAWWEMRGRRRNNDKWLDSSCWRWEPVWELLLKEERLRVPLNKQNGKGGRSLPRRERDSQCGDSSTKKRDKESKNTKKECEVP